MLSLRQVARRGISLRMTGDSRVFFNSQLISLTSSKRYQSTESQDLSNSGGKKVVGTPSENHKRNYRSDDKGPQRSYGYRSNNKIREITNQVNEVLSKEGSQSASQLVEEGLEYLKSIKTSEGISDSSIVLGFRRTISEILDVSRNEAASSVPEADKASAGYNAAISTLNHFSDIGISHVSHYRYLMSEAIRSDNEDSALTLWVKYTQQCHLHPAIDASNNKSNVSDKKEVGLLAYVAYIKKCIKSGKDASSEFATTLLLRKNLPQVGKLFGTARLHNFEISDEIRNIAQKLYINTVDPNDPTLTEKLMDEAVAGNGFATDRALNNIRDASKYNGTPISEITISKFMRLYNVSNRFERSCDLFDELLNNGIVPKINTWNVLIDTVGSKSFQDKTLKVTQLDNIYKTLLASNVSPDAETYCFLIKGYGSAKRMDKVMELLEVVKSQRHIPFTGRIKDSYIISLISTNEFNDARKKLSEYQSEGNYIPDISVINKFLSGYISEKQYSKANEILELAENSFIPLDVASYTIIIDMLFKTAADRGTVPTSGAIDELFEEMQKKNLKANIFTLTVIFNGLMKIDNIEAARKVFEMMKKSGVKLTKTTYVSAISGELSYGDSNKAEALFEDYLKDGFLPETPLWNVMIRGFLRLNNPEKALKYYDTMRNVKKANYRTNPNHFTFSFLLDYFVRNRNFEKTSLILRDIKAAQLPNISDNLKRTIRRARDEGVKIPQDLLILI